MINRETEQRVGRLQEVLLGGPVLTMPSELAQS